MVFSRYVFCGIFIALGSILLPGASIYMFSLFEWGFKTLKMIDIESFFLEFFLISACFFVASFIYGVLLGVISPSQKKIIPLLAAFMSSILSLIILSMSPTMLGMVILALLIGIYVGFSITSKLNLL